MKKYLLSFAIGSIAFLTLASCESKPEESFVTYRGVTSCSGSFYKTFDAQEKDSIVYDVKTEGEKATVNIPITLTRSTEVLPEGKELDKITLVVSGDDDYKDFEMRIDAAPEEVQKLSGILDKQGESVVVTFTTEILKQELDKIKGKKVWTSLLI